MRNFALGVVFGFAAVTMIAPRLSAQQPTESAEKQWKEKYSVSHGGVVSALAFAPDEMVFATGIGAGKERVVKLWDSQSGKKLAEINNSGSMLKFAPDGKSLFIGSYQKVILWDVREKIETKTFLGLKTNVCGMDVTGDGKKIAACDNRMMILWDLESGQKILTHSEPGKTFTSVAFSPDGSLLALGTGHETTVTKPGEIILWKVAEKKTDRRIHAASGEVHFVAFSPDGTTLAAAGSSNQDDGPPKGGTFLWKLATGVRTKLLPEHQGNGRGVVSFSPKRKLLASSGVDDFVFIWDWTTGRYADVLQTTAKSVDSIAFSPNETYLLVGGWSGRVQVFTRE